MKKCHICENQGKYKCPVCFVPYCSLACCKRHKEEKCKPLEVIPLQVTSFKLSESYQYPTEDTVRLENLKLLGHDATLRRLLDNPHLREFLKDIDTSHNPQGIMQKAMQEPIFVEFADACFAVVERNL